MRAHRLALSTFATLSLAACADRAHLDERVAATMDVPTRVVATLDPSGPTSLTVAMRLVLSGTALDLEGDLAASPADFTIEVDTSPIVGALGASSTLWVELVSENGTVLARPVSVGSTTSGLAQLDVDASLPVDLLVDATAQDCRPGTLRVRPLTLRFVAAARGGGPRDPSARRLDRAIAATVLRPHTTIAMPIRPCSAAGPIRSTLEPWTTRRSR